MTDLSVLTEWMFARIQVAAAYPSVPASLNTLTKAMKRVDHNEKQRIGNAHVCRKQCQIKLRSLEHTQQDGRDFYTYADQPVDSQI